MEKTLAPAFNFLSSLKDNNNREWFQEHKARYEQAHTNVIDFAEKLVDEMRKFDHIETPSGKKSLSRIYRDVRFSSDKSPYKTSWNGHFRRATAHLRGGYYYHLEPGNTFIAGGFFGPNSEDLRHIRNHIDLDDEPLRQVLNSKDIKAYFGELTGEKVKTTPQGFPKEHPSIDLLRYKQFILKHEFTDSEALQPDFYIHLTLGFQKLIPFFNVMSEILTTDLNGNSII